MATTAAAAAAAATAATAATGGVKRVNFDLPSTIDEVAEQEIDNDNDNDSDNSYSLALARPGLNKYSRSSSGSICKPHIVFNGTYPIDMPLGVTPPAPLASHHRSSYDAEANADRSEMQRYRYMMHDYVIDEDAEGEELAEEDDYDDDDDDDDDDEDAYDDDAYDEYDDYDYVLQQNNDFLSKLGIIKQPQPQQQQQRQQQQQPATAPQNVWSMQELIANPGIPINYKKMCTEVEQSLSKFEAYLDAKGQATTTAAATTTSTTPGVVRTYDIDAPTAGNGNGKGSSAAGLALSTKKQI
ncbi:uncharacterized protein [Drosophila virilis]|uniref:uncharacterized protein n=1 Tax=Drosophila virilis TaxID=7244 RepID=UPI0038B2EA89